MNGKKVYFIDKRFFFFLVIIIFVAFFLARILVSDPDKYIDTNHSGIVCQFVP